eukprot:GHVN01077277.1.p1 GENE.GHVN01077277.1~~GHVN01077277.1.p1  ORF type:complete len:136 (+),score=21.23 GHVN01077277.1:182-589(+)
MHRRTHQTGLPPLSDGDRLADPQIIADVFASHYQSVFTPVVCCLENQSVLPPPALTCIPRLSPDCVRSLVLRPKSKTGSGPDGIPPYVVRQMVDVLAEPLLTSLMHRLIRVVSLHNGSRAMLLPSLRIRAVEHCL